MTQELIIKLYNYFDGKGGYKRTKVEQELFLALQKELQTMKPEEVEVYYQPELYSDDGTNIDYGFPEELASFHVFHTKEECEDWLEDNGYDLKDCIIHEYHDDDIEEHVYVD